jgi:hypothetical protein
MSEWLTYSLADMLMFSERVYYRMLALYNQEIWPAQLLAFALGAAILYLLLFPARTNRRDRGIPLLLGGLWAWVAWGFLWERFATINWPVAYLVPLFALQAIWLVVMGSVEGRLGFAARHSAAHIAGTALFAAALLLYPLIAPFMGRSWQSAEIFGLAPDPTALATLALLALAEGWRRWLLMVIPALWCLISAVTLHTMGAADYFLPAAGALAAFAIAVAGVLAGSSTRIGAVSRHAVR